MKILIKAYSDLMRIMFKETPALVITTAFFSIILGIIPPISLWVHQKVFDNGIRVAQGEESVINYCSIIIVFLIVNIAPIFLKKIYINGYIRIRSRLVWRSSIKSRMLEKCKRLKYEHFENDESLEIIEKAYERAEESANAMFPGYFSLFLSSITASIGFIIQLLSIKWWLIFTIMPLFILQTVIVSKKNKNIYDELEKYWEKEKQYTTLANYLKSRNYSSEIKLFEIAPYLINTYQTRLNLRNREYETFYLKHLRKNIAGYNIVDLAVILNVVIFLFLFLKGQISVGLFISLTSIIIGGTRNGIYKAFNDTMAIFNLSGYHINFFEYYYKYLDLEESFDGTLEEVPEKIILELKDVWFKYPGSDQYVLKGINLKIEEGESVSLVGENGAGKSTIVKLLLGLFYPDSGCITINGIDLNQYSKCARSKIFAPIFQDFTRFSITLRENIGVGDVNNIDNEEAVISAAKKSGIDKFVNQLPDKYNTVLNRDFEGGVDLSGGQWQRIALARAFMGDKPFYILDEPTSQLDPVAESKLYDEFSNLVHNKSALFITHRLASTKITDKIFVLENGKISESGTHVALMKLKGTYYTMFNSQKKWYSGKVTEQYE